MTRQQVINLFGSAIEAARQLGYVSRHAIYMWPKTGPIPHEPYMRIRYELRPDAFDADGNLLPANKRKAA